MTSPSLLCYTVTMRTTSIKFNGREVQNPILRKLVAVSAILSVVVILPLAMVFLFAIGLPLILILNWPLKAMGRYGTIRETANGGLELKLDAKAFRSWHKDLTRQYNDLSRGGF